MTSSLYESIARIARHETRARAISTVGVVSETFTAGGAENDYAVSVQVRDLGIVLKRVPVATGVMGFTAIPAVGDLVVILFLYGDYNSPVVVGRLYHPDQDPPEHSNDQIVLKLPSAAGEPKLDLLISGEEGSVLLKRIGESEVLFDMAEGKLQFGVGEMKVTLEAAGGGRAEIAAGGSTIVLKKDGDVSLKSSGKLKLEGSEVEISGSSKVTVTGATVDIN